MMALAALLSFSPVYGQGNKARQAQRKQDRIERAGERSYEKARKKDISHHFAAQTRETQKQMKEAERRAKKFNNQGREGFFKRLFGRNDCNCP